jgi:DNA-binding NarL/FixJ family response regulator
MKKNSINLLEYKLTSQQEVAVGMILDGKSDLEISRKLNMRRQTINVWRNHHVEFMLELKLRRGQAWEKQQEKLSQLVERALDMLTKYLDHENETVRLTAAMAILRMRATQENLKIKETMEMNGSYHEIGSKLLRIADQTNPKERESK